MPQRTSISRAVLPYGPVRAFASPDFSHDIGASRLWIGESSSATKPYRGAEEFSDADRV